MRKEKRKYYYLTDQGKEELNLFINEWKNISGSVNKLLEGK